jgi:hypothetical protein
VEVLYLGDCPAPGLVMEESIQHQHGLPALLAYLRGEAVEGVEDLNLNDCGMMALSEGIGRLVGLRAAKSGGPGGPPGTLDPLAPWHPVDGPLDPLQIGTAP